MNRGILRYPLGRGQYQKGLGFPQGKLRSVPRHVIRATDMDSDSAAALSATAAGSTNAKGAWNVAVPALETYDGFWVTAFMNTQAVLDFLIDIGTGNGPDEVFIQNLLVNSGATFAQGITHFYVPMRVPAGVPLAVRGQSTDASAILTLYGIDFVRGEPYTSLLMKRSQTYGANTADSGGVSLDAGGSANTWPTTFTEIVASTIDPIHYALICFGGQNNATRTEADFSWQLAVGSPGSERLIAVGQIRTPAGGDFVAPCVQPRYLSIPAGERLSARIQSTTNDATDRLIDMAVVGMCR